MDSKYLIDTNIAIYYFDGHLPLPALRFLVAAFDKGECAASVISKMEALGWNFPSPEQEQKGVKFFNRISMLWISPEIMDETIQVRKNLPRTKLPDAIIAATALAHGLVLLTRNTEDFSKIAGLRLLNPFDL